MVGMKNTLIFAIVPATIIGLAIVIATFVYCGKTRYEFHTVRYGEYNNIRSYVFDRAGGVVCNMFGRPIKDPSTDQANSPK